MNQTLYIFPGDTWSL